MKHIKLFEDFVNEAERIPTQLQPSDFRKYFSDIHYDTVKRQYDRDTTPEIAQADNGKWYEVSSAYNRWDERIVKLKSVKAPKNKANESLELDEALNELSLSSVGVKSFLTAMYTNLDAIKKLGFKNFRDLVAYVKTNDLQDWDELRDEARQLGIVIAESVNEGKELSQEEYRKYYPILGHKGAGLEFNFNGQTVGGYVVPKSADKIEDLIAKIEKASKKKLTAIPYNQETGQFASGVGNDTWMKSGRTVIYLQVVKK